MKTSQSTEAFKKANEAMRQFGVAARDFVNSEDYKKSIAQIKKAGCALNALQK